MRRYRLLCGGTVGAKVCVARVGVGKIFGKHKVFTVRMGGFRVVHWYFAGNMSGPGTRSLMDMLWNA